MGSRIQRSGPQRTRPYNRRYSGLVDTSVLPSQVLCSFLVLCLCKRVYFFSILFMPCLPGDMPQGTDNAQQPLHTDTPLHWEVQQHWEEIEAEIARNPPSPPSPPPSPPTPQDTQETHEQQSFRLGRNIPAFLDRDLVDSFRPIYLVADFLFRTNHPVQFGLKHCLYQLLHRLPSIGSGGSSPTPLLFNTLSYKTLSANNSASCDTRFARFARCLCVPQPTTSQSWMNLPYQ